MKLRRTIFVAAVAALVAAPAADAHVTVDPGRVPSGSFARFDIRVPNEEEVPTVQVSVLLPTDLEEVSFQPKPGWERTVASKLGRKVVTWSGGEIGPGEFDDFALSAEVPKTSGVELVFPTVQTYADRKIVRWIEAPSGEFPAPRVTVEAAESETGATAAGGDNGDEHDELAIGLAIAGLAAALLAVGLTLVRRRRT